MANSQESDMHFDASALFRHCVENLDRDMSAPRQWQFAFENSSIEHLEQIGEGLIELLFDTIDREPDQFAAELVPSIPTILADGTETDGPPTLFLQFVDVLTEIDLEELHKQFAIACSAQSINYNGVESYEPFDEELL